MRGWAMPQAVADVLENHRCPLSKIGTAGVSSKERLRPRLVPSQSTPSMGEQSTAGDELLRICVPSGRPLVGVAAGAAAGVARVLGFADDDAERVRSVVDALCREVVARHFDDPATAEFTLILAESHGALKVRVEDTGLPYPMDSLVLDDATLIGRLLAHGVADAIRFESRGVDGNSVELCLLPAPDRQVHLAAQEDPGTALVDADAPVTVRALTAADAPSLARCIYRCYGYTYANDFIYYPEQVLSLIERGLMRSLVGLSEQGEVVGHSGLLRDHAESRVAESGMAVVDPRYRNHHLLRTLKGGLVDFGRDMDLVGTYADAVAVHEITQKANAAIGAVETGLLLAEIPAFTIFRGFEREPRQRGSVVLYFHPIGDVPERTVFVPQRYRALLESIYGRLGLRRTLQDPQKTNAPASTSIHVEMKARRGLARIEVEAAGCDVAAQVGQRFRQLCQNRFDVIHLDLALGDATAVAAVDDFAALGFFFGGILPELRQGDVLRLQYLNNVELDRDRIVLYSEEAKRLLDAILADRG